MSDDTLKTGDSQDTSSGEAPDQSLEALKAKLGIKPRAAEEPVVEAPKPKETVPETKPPVEAPQPAAPVITEEELAAISEALPTKKTSSLVIVIAAVLALFFGMLAGSMLKSRSIENSKTNEANHLLGVFTEDARVEAIGEGNVLILEVFMDHVADLSRVYDALSEAKDPQARAAAEKELTEFLKRTKTFLDRKAYYNIEQVFKGVIFNGDVAFDVVRFVTQVKQIYDHTVLLALEASTLEAVGGLAEEGDTQSQYIFVESLDKEGVRWLKGTWISRIDIDNPRPVNGGVQYALLPVGSGEAFLADSKDLMEIDVTPISKTHAVKYEGAIRARVLARLKEMKDVADQVDFEAIKEKLQALANRGTYITPF